MTMANSDSVLDFWHSIEFFNSYDLDNSLDEARASRSVELVSAATLAEGMWEKQLERRRVLYLLPFDVSHVTLLIEQYVQGPEASEINRVRDTEMASTGLTCYARLTLDPSGKPDFQGMSVSALPWALGRLIEHDLGALCAVDFEGSVHALKRGLADDWSQCQGNMSGPELIDLIVTRLQQWANFDSPHADLAYMDIWPLPKGRKVPAAIEPTEAESESTAEQVPVDDLPILNSFYVHDLAQAKRLLNSDRPPLALKAYLALADRQKTDLDSEIGQEAIRVALQPEKGINGRWPSESQHIQSLMQQFALNSMRDMPVGEVLAVNGPPGTGKTTLLRDLIAHLVVERADVLSRLARAEDGLSGQSITAVFNKKSYKIPLLSEALTGFEMVVASTNNGAVENLSLELPQLKGIDARFSSWGYFKEVATRYAGAHDTKAWKAPEPVWGLVSAALGKKSNRRRFRDIFVNRAVTPTDKPGDRFLNTDKVDLPAWEKVGAMTYRHYKSSSSTQRPDFKGARQRYIKAREAYDEQLKHLQTLSTLYERLHQMFPAIKAMWPVAPALSPENLTELLEGCTRLIGRLKDRQQALERKLGPVFFRWLAQWFRKPLYKQWIDTCADADKAREFESELRDLPALIKTCDVQLWDGKPLDSKANQSRALWQGSTFNTVRSDLFVAAMTLHEAFFLEVANNDLIFALTAMLDRPPLQSARRAVWQWMFMLTPVVSSTFASIRAQFAGLEAEDLGWLIIDEAGQAAPQAAVGAIMRAKRVVVVGDPLQIEPVVTQSTRLLDTLGQHWLGDGRSRYAIDSHSVQTFADRGYREGVKHPLDEEKYIGIPLVMHRRCDNPMFDISNRIAYAMRMQHAKESTIAAHPVLGVSAWWSVVGESEDGTKYIEAQGQRLLGELVRLYQSVVKEGAASLPLVFIITPFREVKSGLVRLLGDPHAWAAKLPAHIKVPANLATWVRTCIGTVHTFQGKEADIVFFVLGCDSSRMGAIDWASASPNLLNVAVTRAKKHLYIVGDQALWGGQPHFDVALDFLTKAKASQQVVVRESFSGAAQTTGSTA